MTSAAQVQANRSNAQKSTGPRTPEGKAAVAQNAIKHGLLAQAAVLRDEEQERYARYRAEMLEELSPAGRQEMELAERIVHLSWRLERAARHQDALFAALYEQAAAAEAAAGSDGETPLSYDRLVGRMLVADFSGPRLLERAQLYERRIESSLYRARADLRSHQALARAARAAAQAQGRAPARMMPESSVAGRGPTAPAPVPLPPASARAGEKQEPRQTNSISQEAVADREAFEQTKPIAGPQGGDPRPAAAVRAA